MGQIQEVAVKFRNCSRTKSILEDLGNPENSMTFSEESLRTIHEMGNIELYELGQISRTVQCQSCSKHIPKRLIFCACGVCLQPDEETIKRIKARFQALICPYHLARVNRSRGKKHGETSTIVIRWHEDEQYRNSQQAHGWTEEYCGYLDYFTYTAPWNQRHRYESTITLVCNDEDRQAGSTKAREDFKPTSKILASFLTFFSVLFCVPHLIALFTRNMPDPCHHFVPGRRRRHLTHRC